MIQYLLNTLSSRDPDTFIVGYGNDSLDFTSVFWQNKESATVQNIAIAGPFAWLKFDNRVTTSSDFFFVVSEEEPGKLSDL